MSTVGLSPSAVLVERRSDLLRVLKRFNVTRAGVFGSAARGTDEVGSDIDLVVVFAPEAAKDLIRLGEQLSAVASVPVDVVDAEQLIRRAQETGIGSTILRDTVPL